jgi:hypothetical protein
MPSLTEMIATRGNFSFPQPNLLNHRYDLLVPDWMWTIGRLKKKEIGIYKIHDT